MAGLDVPQLAGRPLLVSVDRPGSGLIDQLRSGAAADLIEPDQDELSAQIGVELEVSNAHLRSILDRYWDRDWRRDNRHHASPEDQLWRAATAVTELEDALDKSDT